MRLTLRPSTALVLTLALGLAALLGEIVWPRTAWGQEELFVADSGNNSITVYSRMASGNTAPIRTLVGAATGLSGPVGLGVAATVTNPLTINYSVQGCSGREMFLVLNAPALGIPFSYFNGSTFVPLPDPLSLITPFVTGGAVNIKWTSHALRRQPAAWDVRFVCGLRLHPKRPSGHHESAVLPQRGLRLSSLDRTVTASGLDITVFGY